MSQKFKTTVVWVLLIIVFLLLFQLTGDSPKGNETFATFLEHVDGGEISGVRINSNEITVSRWDGYDYVTLGVVDDDLTRRLSESGVVVAWGEEENPLRSLILVGVPLLLILGFFVYFLRKGMAGGTGNILSLKKSRARLVEDSKVTFADVGGCADAKQQLGDLIDFLRAPERWTDAGVRLPRGVLLEGPPGCGKTLLARAVAGETDANFYLVSASEFVEMFVGVGAARVRDMFETAAKEAPSVIFIDELDAVGRKRGSGIGAAHDEREQTLNQILVCLDGFESHDQVVVIAATNRADILDAALLRHGRFDRRIAMPELDRETRIEVLSIHTRNKKLGDDVSLADIADRTGGFSGAQLETLANEAGLLAVRRSRRDDSSASAEVALRSEDFSQAMAPAENEKQRFDRVDSLIIESTTQLSQSTGRARVRITLLEGGQVEGELVWANAGFVKVRANDGSGAMVPKNMIKTLEALEGTEWADADDVLPDKWANAKPDLA
jgi:cell division protease FtsH